MSFNTRRKENPPLTHHHYKRKPLVDITNDTLDPRKSLQDELSGSNLSVTEPAPAPARPSPRIFSGHTHVLGLGRPSLRTTALSRSVSASAVSRLTPFRDPTPDLTADNSISNEPLLSPPPTADWGNRSTSKNAKAKQGLYAILSDDAQELRRPLGVVPPRASPSSAAAAVPDIDRPHTCPPDSPQRNILPSLEPNRPAALTTSLLKPKTHKVSQGQVVVLPSKSLLVDFREGERRKGRKGNEVLVISADGQQVRCRVIWLHIVVTSEDRGDIDSNIQRSSSEHTLLSSRG